MFLAFRLPNREPGLLSGDIISRLSADWEMWLVTLEYERYQATVGLFQNACNDSNAQKDFLEWVHSLSDFSGELLDLACYQLLQCEGFSNWSELAPWRERSFLPSQCGINCIFLRHDSPGSPGLLKSMIAVVGAKPLDTQHYGRIVPLNFSVAHSDEPTLRSLDEARRAALSVLSPRGLIFWSGYLLTGDFIALTAYRLIRLLWYAPELRRRLRIRHIYVFINTRTGTPVGGPSLGAATMLATLMGVSRGLGRNLFVEKLFRKIFGSGLAGTAVTGCVNGCRIHRVDGIRQKLECLRDSPGISRAIVPHENLREVGSTSLKDAFAPPVPVIGSRTVNGLLRRIVRFRKTWLIINAAVLIAMATFPWTFHAFLPTPSFAGAESSTGHFDRAQAIKGGLRLRRTDHVRIFVHGVHPGGPTTLSVSCARAAFDNLSKQCLRESSGEGDWRSSVSVPVLSGVADFYYHRDSEGTGMCDIFTIEIVHHGRETLFALPLVFEP
jgi:hypothetical protein